MRHILLALAGLAIAGPGFSQTVPPPSGSVQQQFEAATDAFAASQWQQALDLFQALEHRLANGNQRSLAVIRVRLGMILIELGRLDEAGAALRQGLDHLPADDRTLDTDRYEGLVGLGRLAEARLRYPEALAQFRAAAAVEIPPAQRLSAYRGMVQTQLFDDPQTALRDADAALAIAAQIEANRNLVAQIRTLKGRALLNLGRFSDARAELTRAMQMLGDLTMRVDYSDLLARSDLALAALLQGDREDARRYLAYTGSGRFEEGYLAAALGNRPPPCGDGISPEDVAVIQFWVFSDGTVGSVTPIYASRSGPVALAFARAVSGWTFRPESLRNIPMLFLAASRVEIRCSRLRSTWIDNVEALHVGSDEPPLPDGRNLLRPLRDAATALAALPGTPPRDLVAAWAAVAEHPLVETEERHAAAARALEAAARTDTDPATIATLALLASRQEATELREDIPAALSLPAVRQSASATAILDILRARILYRRGERGTSEALTRDLAARPAVRSDPRLAEQVDILTAQIGRDAAPDEVPRTIGASDSCLITPARRRNPHASSNDFPDEALRWGFEGWAVTEYEVAPDGRPTDIRTVAAYPPFVFSPAARSIFERIRYERPGSGGCVVRQTIRFRLAN